MTLNPTKAAGDRALPVPPLRNGDRLSRAEFERRYQAMPPNVKAELIEGVVFMPSPVSHDEHGLPHAHLITWLGTYSAFTPGVQVGDNSTLRLDLDNEPQPDACLRIPLELGGQSRTVDGYITGGPELAGEVSASSASYDLHSKLNAYRRNGIREYIVWRTEDGALDWFVLRESHYDRLQPGVDGLYRSEAFPGLWLAPAALLALNLARVLQVLQQGLAAPEHAAFVAELQSRASP